MEESQVLLSQFLMTVDAKFFKEVTFNDGTYNKFSVENILKEFLNDSYNQNVDKVKWDSSLKISNNFNFEENIFEKKIMYEALIHFYKYGFVIFKKVPCFRSCLRET